VKHGGGGGGGGGAGTGDGDGDEQGTRRNSNRGGGGGGGGGRGPKGYRADAGGSLRIPRKRPFNNKCKNAGAARVHVRDIFFG
jgi:hypothetical protein